MAVDRPGDYVGNHGGGYVDNDGQRKQFTYIDHDPKTKISGLVSTDKDKEAIKDSLSTYKKELVQRILDVPASLSPIEFYEFTVRGEGQSVITWNETMLRDEGITLNRLRDLCTILERRFESNVI